MIPWLLRYVQSYGEAALQEPALFECLDSWANELSLADIISSGMIDTIYAGVRHKSSFSAAVSCLCTILDSNGVSSENQVHIYEFYKRTIALQPQIAALANEESEAEFIELTKLFCVAGETWSSLILEQPDQFRPLIQCALECVRLDVRRKAVPYTFYFWLKLSNLVSEAAKGPQFMTEFLTLFDLMIDRVQYPSEAGDDSLDPFQGDKEEEGYFRDSRHDIGDVLKDCCLIIDASDCLDRLRYQIEEQLKVAPRSWQRLEALLFSVRAIGRMVSMKESRSFSSLLLTILSIDTTSNHKLLFQVIMVISRYTLWSAGHPDSLRPQLDYILPAFESPMEDIRNAAASAFRFFGTDCGKHLTGLIDTIQPFYVSSLSKLALSGQLYLTEGVASIITQLPPTEVQPALAQFCGPIVDRIIACSQTPGEASAKMMTDSMSLLSVFIDILHPRNRPESPIEATVLPYWQLVLKTVSEAARPHWNSTSVVEQLSVCWRMLVYGIRTRIVSFLPFLLKELTTGFDKTHDARFIWVSSAVVSTFRHGDCDPAVAVGVFQFYEYLMNAFGQLDRSDPNQLVDEIDDTFRLAMTALIYHPIPFFSSATLPTVVSNAVEILASEQKLHPGPLSSVLRFLRCFLTYGLVKNGPAMHVCPPDASAEQQAQVAQQVVGAVRGIVAEVGLKLTYSVFTRVTKVNPYDAVSDAFDLLQGMFEVEPGPSTECLVRLMAELLEPDVQAAPETIQLKNALTEYQHQLAAGADLPARGIFQELVIWHGWLHPGEDDN